MAKTRPVHLVWFKGVDLRVRDNYSLYRAALDAAANKGLHPITVALVTLHPDEYRLHDMGAARVHWMLRALQELRRELGAFSIPLIVRTVPCVERVSRGLKKQVENREKHVECETLESEKAFALAKDFNYIDSYSSPLVSPYIALRTAMHRQLAELIDSVAQEWNVVQCYWNKQFELDEWLRDKLVRKKLEARGIKVTEWDRDQCLIRPGSCVSAKGSPHSVFTPFKKQLLSLIREDSSLLKVSPFPEKNSSDCLSLFPEDEIPLSLPFYETAPTELLDQWPLSQEAIDLQLNQFIANIMREYSGLRDFLGRKGTSYLSPYLSLGRISTRLILERVLAAAPDATTRMSWLQPEPGTVGPIKFISELCWREFYRHVAFHFPSVHYPRPFQEKFKLVRWLNEIHVFEAWCQGRTGVPIVDAGMRCLVSTGYLHNRLRMLCASYLSKHLLVDWRLGERFFAQHLLDFDFCSNNGGWQSIVGCGTDTSARYFTVFNPSLQVEKYDNDGTFIRRWVPELNNVTPLKALCDPVSVLGAAQVQSLGYVLPVVNHRMANERIRSAYELAVSK